MSKRGESIAHQYVYACSRCNRPLKAHQAYGYMASDGPTYCRSCWSKVRPERNKERLVNKTEGRGGETG